MNVTSPRNKIRRLHGVYDASGTVAGEIAYFLRRTFLGRHCSLCDITHSTLSRRRAWDDCVDQLGIEFVLHHSDKVPHEVTRVPEYSAPCVVGEFSDGSFCLLIDATELERCDHSPERLMQAIQRKIGNEDPL